MASPSPHSPSDPEEFSKKLKEWHQAISSEFEAIDADDSEEVLKLVKKKFIASALVMADDLVGLARNATSEAVQLSSIKFAYEFIFGKDSEKESGMDALLKQLTTGSVDD